MARRELYQRVAAVHPRKLSAEKVGQVWAAVGKRISHSLLKEGKVRSRRTTGLRATAALPRCSAAACTFCTSSPHLLHPLGARAHRV